MKTKITPAIFVILLVTHLFPKLTNGQSISKEEIIHGAILAAPEALREGAMVYGYNSEGKVYVLREGANQMVCLADDPAADGFSAACYHKDLEPFMARGRELKAEGKKFKEIFDIRESEVKAGKLKMPEKAMLHILTGDSYDPATKTVINEYRRWTFYIPYATSETSGLPDKPAGPGIPWLMDAGTHRAHIMIMPEKN